MSKNFDLLQQAAIRIGGLPAFDTEKIAVETKHQPATIAEGLTAKELAAREESLKLVQRLFLDPGQAAPKAVMFSAIDSKKGCSWLCAVIGKLLAENISGSVCLVEGNFRTPSLSKVLGADNPRGLSDALRQGGAIKSFAEQVGPNNFWLLSSGSLGVDSLNLLNSNGMKERVSELRREFDYLLIDAPPLNAYSDGMVLGRLADGVVLVLEANRTRREAARKITEGLRTSKIAVLGAILSDRTFPIPAALYKRL